MKFISKSAALLVLIAVALFVTAASVDAFCIDKKRLKYTSNGNCSGCGKKITVRCDPCQTGKIHLEKIGCCLNV